MSSLMMEQFFRYLLVGYHVSYRKVCKVKVLEETKKLINTCIQVNMEL